MIYETGIKFTLPYIRYFITMIYPLHQNGGSGALPREKKIERKKIEKKERKKKEVSEENRRQTDVTRRAESVWRVDFVGGVEARRL